MLERLTLCPECGDKRHQTIRVVNTGDGEEIDMTDTMLESQGTISFEAC